MKSAEQEVLKEEKPKQLQRNKLKTEIAGALKGPLLLVTAPSGYGKTWLVKQFFEEQNRMKAIWLSFGQNEVDEEWVWQKLCLLMAEFDEKYAQQIKQLGLPKTEQEMDYFLKLLRSHLIYPTCFIIDDYQECRGENINRLIARIVYEEIPHLHVILISRIVPDIAYEEWILRGYCKIINQQSLTLSKEEVNEIFQINGVSLLKEDLENVFHYTDGWISAVYLLLLEYKAKGKLKFSFGVIHLLKTSILDKLDRPLKNVFMGMSLFDSFTIEQASYVLEQASCEPYLAEVAEQLGFLQYDGKKYEMHALMRQTAYLELEKSDLDIMHLYHRNAEWEEREENYILAIINYKKSGDIVHILKILSKPQNNIIFEKVPAIMREIFSEMDLKTCLDYPVAYLRYIYFITMNDKAEIGKKLLEQAKEAYSIRQKRKEVFQYERLFGEMYIIEALQAFNDLEKMNECLKRADELLGYQGTDIFYRNLYTYGSPHTLLLYHKKVGELQKIVELEKQYSHLYMKLICHINGGWEQLFDAEYAYNLGHIDKAEKFAKTAVEKAKFREQTCILISCYNILLRCAIINGDRRAFDKLSSELAEEMKGIGSPVLLIDYDLVMGYAYSSINQIERIAFWLQEFNLKDCSRVIRRIRNGCIVYGIILKQKKQWVLLDAVADQMFIPYEQSSHILVLIVAHVYKAIAVFHLEGIQAGRKYLKMAIEMAEPDHIVMPFVENSDEMMPLLLEEAKASKFVADMLSACNYYQNHKQAFYQKVSKISLTNREVELMGYVKKGYTNIQISAVMNIALVTVEKSLTNIYRKLGVTNRATAVAKLTEEEKIQFS